LRAEGIEWFCLPYHKRPTVPATVYDILAGAWFAARHVRRARLDVLHARAHVPLAMALLARALSPARVRLVFDIRGLMAEEYADAGVWSEKSAAYRAVKRLERAGLRRADRIVVLTRRMRDWLVGERMVSAERVVVIPCCVDFSRYGVREEAEASSGEGEAARDADAEASDADAGTRDADAETSDADAEARDADDETGGGRFDETRGGGRFEVVYAGSATGLYMLEEMGRYFACLRAREPRAFLRVLTASPHEEAAAVLRRAGLAPGEFWVGFAPAAEVPRYLRRARLGLSFRKPTFSQIAASPTKIAEYLAAGLPVVSNAGIGDTDWLLADERVGVLVGEFTREEYARAAEASLKLAGEPGVGARCAAAARKHFDLAAIGGARYLEIYRRLEGPPEDPPEAKPSR
jgi:glycosyltransferase involved in cell wall biosynthesis